MVKHIPLKLQVCHFTFFVRVWNMWKPTSSLDQCVFTKVCCQWFSWPSLYCVWTCFLSMRCTATYFTIARNLRIPPSTEYHRCSIVRSHRSTTSRKMARAHLRDWKKKCPHFQQLLEVLDEEEEENPPDCYQPVSAPRPWGNLHTWTANRGFWKTTTCFSETSLLCCIAVCAPWRKFYFQNFNN